MSFGLMMTNGALNSTIPLALRRRLVEVDDDRVQRIPRIDFEADRAVQPFVRADIAEARAVGDRLDTLDDQRDDARVDLEGQGEHETHGDGEPLESLLHRDTSSHQSLTYILTSEWSRRRSEGPST